MTDIDYRKPVDREDAARRPVHTALTYLRNAGVQGNDYLLATTVVHALMDAGLLYEPLAPHVEVHPGVGATVTFPAREPALPPEPPDGTVLRGGPHESTGSVDVWQRDDHGRDPANNPARRWWRPGDDLSYTWETALQLGADPSRRLVEFRTVSAFRDGARG